MEIYFIIVLCVLLLLYTLYEMHFEDQHIMQYERLKIKHAYYCSKCDSIYMSLEHLDIAPCPKCSHDNAYIRF